MKPEFTNVEQIIFKTHRDFWMKNGDSEATATEKAMGKILNVRMMKKKVARY
jgi:hypothetical protein